MPARWSGRRRTASATGSASRTPPRRSSDLRWRAPQPPKDWSGNRKADKFGPPCLQAGQQTLNPDSMEDCLYLNVHRPAEMTDDLPVMVWIHGGGLKTGTSTLPLEMAKGLVDQGVVLVSVSYRLGRLGYFAHPALEAEAEERGEEPVANFGLLDQIAALEWVQDNIEGFGGDADNVTIFGISAGGVSVNYLMSSPQGRRALRPSRLPVGPGPRTTDGSGTPRSTWATRWPRPLVRPTRTPTSCARWTPMRSPGCRRCCSATRSRSSTRCCRSRWRTRSRRGRRPTCPTSSGPPTSR